MFSTLSLIQIVRVSWVEPLRDSEVGSTLRFYFRFPRFCLEVYLTSSSPLPRVNYDNTIILTRDRPRQGIHSILSMFCEADRASLMRGQPVSSCPATLFQHVLSLARRISILYVDEADTYLLCPGGRTFSFCAQRGGSPCDFTCSFRILLSLRGPDFLPQGDSSPGSFFPVTFNHVFPGWLEEVTPNAS